MGELSFAQRLQNKGRGRPIPSGRILRTPHGGPTAADTFQAVRRASHLDPPFKATPVHFEITGTIFLTTIDPPFEQQVQLLGEDPTIVASDHISRVPDGMRLELVLVDVWAAATGLPGGATGDFADDPANAGRWTLLLNGAGVPQYVDRRPRGAMYANTGDAVSTQYNPVVSGLMEPWPGHLIHLKSGDSMSIVLTVLGTANITQLNWSMRMAGWLYFPSRQDDTLASTIPAE